MEEVTVKVFDIINSDTAVSSDYAEMVFSKVNALLKEGKLVALDFAHITVLISAFLNVAVGKLYKEYDSDFIDSHVRIENFDRANDDIYKRVVKNAKNYYRAFTDAEKAAADEAHREAIDG